MRQVLHTDYASPERLRYSDLEEQVKYVDTVFDQSKLGDALPDILTIINEHRQIVFANARLYEFLDDTKQNVMGKRPGEVLDCIHACGSENGCGTTEFCRECGAVNAILEAQKAKQSVKECHILAKGGKAYDLQVWAPPVYVGSKPFTIFSIKDISHEKRRSALERTFFHDILNTAGNVATASELLKTADTRSTDFLEMIAKGSIQLVEEINSQRSLLAAERGELTIKLDTIEPTQMIDSLSSLYEINKIAKDKHVTVAPCPEIHVIKTDKVILRRSLSNLLKNALEASNRGETITIGCKNEGNGVVFFVNNCSYMPRKYQLKVFQRSFSTKGAGRGIGTYSVKLFVEQYLGGRVWFESDNTKGTTFSIYLPESSPLRDVAMIGSGNV